MIQGGLEPHAGGTSIRRTAKKVDEEFLRTVKDRQQAR